MNRVLARFKVTRKGDRASIRGIDGQHVIHRVFACNVNDQRCACARIEVVGAGGVSKVGNGCPGGFDATPSESGTAV